MLKMPIIKNQSGAGIFLMMFVFASLIGAGFYINELIMGSEKLLQKDSKVEAYRHMVELVRKNIYAGSNCSAIFGKTSPTAGVSITSALLPGSLGVDVEVPMTLGSTSTILKPGWKASTGTSIKSIKLLLEPQVVRPSQVRLHGDPLPKTAAYATLIIEPDHKGINIQKRDATGKLVHTNLFVKLMVYYEDQGGDKKIFSCFDPTSEAAMCTSALGGGYNQNPAITSNQRCQPDLQCFTFKGGIVPAGTACPAPYAASQVGANLQICHWCHPEPLFDTPTAGIAYVASNNLDLDIENESGMPVNCNSLGYSNLNAQEDYEARAEYESQIAFLTPAQRAQHQECLNYEPPDPTPPPTTGGAATGGTNGGTSGGTTGGTDGGTTGGLTGDTSGTGNGDNEGNGGRTSGERRCNNGRNTHARIGDGLCVDQR